MGANAEDLKAAAEVLADEVRKQAGAVSSRTAGAVNVKAAGGGWEINAGYPGGRWGWDPIQGWMFDEGAKHPLFGDRSHWYAQKHWPFMALAVSLAIDKAADAYADKVIDRMVI